MHAAVREAVELWLERDPDAHTRAEVERALAEGRIEELEERLHAPRLAFGTAGIRGAMGFGYDRYCALVVLQTTQGLGAYLISEVEGALEKGVAVGFDGRHGSRGFAWIAAQALLARGFRVSLLEAGLAATPLLAFAVAHGGCAAGVMITASHNPPQDNGFKVFDGRTGCQIVSPVDEAVAAAIEENLEPWPRPPETELRASDRLSDPTEEVTEAYFASMREALCFRGGADVEHAPRACYTALHGVGAPFVTRACAEFGLLEPVPVAEQISPDPDFPTVAFPNPEEGRATWALAFATGDREECELCIANDPDADRLAVAERCAEEADGWRSFSGNEIGAMLAHWVFTQWTERRRRGGGGAGAGAGGEGANKGVAMLASAVSSKLLRAMAAKEGFHFEETLTGFKWLGNGAKRLKEDGYDVLFMFEEAIGFAFGEHLLDKDGVAAAAVLLELAAYLRATEGLTLAGYLDRIRAEYGFFAGRQGYYIASDPSVSAAVFARLREIGYVDSLAGMPVTSIRDLGRGTDTANADGKATLPPDPLMVTLRLEPFGELTIRASGTEPKLKVYVECVDEEDQARAMATAEALYAAVYDDILTPIEGLQKPPISD